MSNPNTPHTQSGEPTRPSSARRPGTASRRPRQRPTTARPDTTASSIGDLPDQQFFPEGEDFDEDEEFDDEEMEEDVFAFERPVTGAVPRVAFSEATTSPPVTGDLPKTAETGFSEYTTGTEPTSQEENRVGPSSVSSKSIGSPVPEPTGNMDVGGRIPELYYDVANPPPFSGRENLNNSSFAFVNKLNQERAAAKAQARQQRERPNSGRSLLSRLQRRRVDTGTTDASGLTGYTEGQTELSQVDYDSRAESDGGSFTTELTGSGRPGLSKRSRSSAPLIPGTSSSRSDFSSDPGSTQRGISRGSYGMTEISGDMTVPDGKTTWGDGMGGMIKDGSEGESMGGLEYDLAEEDSPFPEVRASVSNIDDPEMPALTIRSWTLGMIMAILFTGVNTFFHFRTPAPYISPFVVQVLVYPVGKFTAWIMPIRTFTLPRWLGSVEFSLNPGPFNIKEHSLISIMSSVAVAPAYGLYAAVSSELWYGKNFGPWFNILFILSTQITGFAFAGLCRRFVVWPASMIWPSVLVVATNLNTLHADDEGFTGGISRFKFLMLTGAGAFVWYFVPGFLFTALSYFSFICWIAPTNSVVNQLFGVSTGLGYSMLTFDWTQVTWIGFPLITPWWAEVNWLIGFVVFYWIITPIMYYTNVWYTAYLPVNVIQAADRFGTSYDIFAILTPDIRLNMTAYQEYSPIYLSASFNMTFMLAFALSTGILVHTALYHGPRIYRAVINVKTEADDIHMKLMRQYPEVPDWWFGLMFLVCFALAVIAMEVFHTGLPVWGYLLSVLLPFIYTIPAAFIYAMTAQSVSINLLAELIPGYLFQNQPIPGMIFKTFGVQSVVQAVTFVQDQKVGHYMKLPPRATFIAQLSAAIISSFVQVGTKELLFHLVPDICGAQQRNLLTCASTKVFFTSSIIWGLIGPQRLFSKGYLYHPEVWALLIGAILPIPLWLWVRKWPRSIFRNVNLPVIINGGTSIPPATGINYSSFFIVGFIFQFWIRRRHFAWWSKYNYVLSVALDVGTALSALTIFLVLDLPGATLNWWGNTVYQNTADWNGVGASYLTPPETGFGPDVW